MNFSLSPEEILGGAMIVAATFYALMGGADYGGGVWDLLAFGSRAKQQRETIAEAIGPIWEANHVWLILVIVILFTCFPRAFSAISIVLHIPLSLLLIGIIMRGSAFTFRTYDSHKDNVQRFWGRIFAISSTITPILLGIIIGVISSGDIIVGPGVDGTSGGVGTSSGIGTSGGIGTIGAVSDGFGGSPFYNVYVQPWIQPFPIAVGFLALSLFAYLAAVYLTNDTKDLEVQNDFRRRAIVSFFVSGAIAGGVFVLAKTEAPEGFQDLVNAFPIHIGAAISAVGSLVCLFKRHFRLARLFAAMQVSMILWGWALGQYPYLLRPDLTIRNCAANPLTLNLVIAALVVGAVLLFPSFYYLMRIFKLTEKRDTKEAVADSLSP